MRALLFVLAATVVAPACGDKELDQLSRVRDRVCACHDPACADAALADIPSQDIHPTPRAQGIANQIFRCVARTRDEAANGSGTAGSDGSGSG